MKHTSDVHASILELLEVCRERRNSYIQLRDHAKDDFCRDIMIENINQSEAFIQEITHTYPEVSAEESNTFISLVYKTFVVLRPIEEYKVKRELFIIAEEIERATIEFYENILTDSLPVPLDMIVTHQLNDIKSRYQKIAFITQALGQV